MVKKHTVKMQFHPRAFAAFGSDLITNDFIAMHELVKNAYDAFAYAVRISFDTDGDNGNYIEIEDDGLGMTQEIIEQAWAVIATPYKKNKPFVERNGKVRIVSGNKGLGRLSAARLGNKMMILSKNSADDCVRVDIDWGKLAESTDIESCGIEIDNGDYDFLLKRLSEDLSSDSNSGTIIRIYDLHTEWEDKQIDELKKSLGRLISPFDEMKDFAITVSDKGNLINVEAHEFIKKPTYQIVGAVNDKGEIEWRYNFQSSDKTISEKTGVISWEEAYGGFNRNKIMNQIGEEEIPNYSCGSFSFELRAWDLDTESVDILKKVFDIKKSEIRKTIAMYKGISIYRDNVLVLPKSDASKDWLGIDLRRISNIGRRLSTNQIVGKVSISEEGNPQLKDTTDREKLVDTKEYQQFCYVLETIVVQFENLRNMDRGALLEKKPGKLVDLISPIDPTALESQIESLVRNNSGNDEILDAVHEYSANTEKSIGELKERMEYYAQTASLGSVAFVIMHELRTGMMAVKRYITRSKKVLPVDDKLSYEYCQDAELAHERLIDVANSFAPLYRKNFNKEKNSADLNVAIKNSIRLIKAKKEAKNVQICLNTDKQYIVGMHSGEVQTIIINLLDNACYWLEKIKGEKIINITVLRDESKVKVNISDNGPGIDVEDIEKIFLPGITAKTHGIGMGLVVVTELLNNHDCSIETIVPGDLDGATFIFELPLMEEIR